MLFMLWWCQTVVRQMSTAARLRQTANEAAIGTTQHLETSESVIRPSLQESKNSQRLHSGVRAPPTLTPSCPFLALDPLKASTPLQCLEALVLNAQSQCSEASMWLCVPGRAVGGGRASRRPE